MGERFPFGEYAQIPYSAGDSFVVERVCLYSTRMLEPDL